MRFPVGLAGGAIRAGPFGDDGAAEDPAVKAGRLVLDASPWMTLKGILK